jgi:Porin subfamily
MMKTKKMAAWLLAGVATATLMSTGALAATAKEQQLEARMEALERAFGSLQGELQTTKAENTELRQAVVSVDSKASEAVTVAQAAKAAPTAPAADGFTVGSGATRVKIGGFIKTVATFSKWSNGDVAANSLGRDFYLPQAIPIGGVRESTDNDFSAKQTRLWLNLDTQVAGHTLKGYVETDFQTAAGTQGSERTTNGYNLALRRAYVQFDKLTVGQDWSTFQNATVLPESTDFVGTTEGTVFVRQPLVRYSAPLGKSTTLHFGIENPESATANLGSTALIENDDDGIPDFTARLNHVTSFGEFAVAGLVRQLAVDNGVIGDDAMGYGVSVSGKINFDAAKRYDLRFMATYGSGIGRYVGLNFAPDAVFVSGANRLRPVKTFASFAALRLGWTPTLRSTLMGSYQNAKYPDGFPVATFDAYNDEAWSVAGNLFWSPVKGFDLGVEYRHGERILVSGANGSLNRLEFAAKYSF